MLDSEDARMLLVVMDAVSAILAVGKKLMAAGSSDCDFAMLFDEAGLPARLDELQNHTQDDVYTRAMGIIEAYFSDEEEGEETIEPQQGATFSFGAVSSNAGGPFGVGAAPFATTMQQSTPSSGFGGNHGVGGGVAPVQLFASPSAGSSSLPGGRYSAAVPPPALPPTMFSFDAVSFV